MPSIESHIKGSQKLIGICGRWPSFHDAEVIEFHLNRGQMKRGTQDGGIVLPFITARIHVFKETPGSHHTLTTLRFEDMEEFGMEDFNHQNAIFGLVITLPEPSEINSGKNSPSYFDVKFQSAFGISASFRCTGIEVVEAVRCTEDGKPHVPPEADSPVSVDTSKSLAVLSGLDWGPAPSEANELIRARHELRRKPMRELSDENIRRLLDMGCDAALLIPVALERSKASDSVSLLCAALRVRDFDWRGHHEMLEAVRGLVYHQDNLLNQIEGNLDTFSARVAIWRLYAEFERDLSAPSEAATA